MKTEEREAIQKKIAGIREKEEEQVRLSRDLDYSREIEKHIPDAFEHGSVKIEWTDVKRTQVRNEHPRMGWVYAGILVRGDGSVRAIPRGTLLPRASNPSLEALIRGMRRTGSTVVTKKQLTTWESEHVINKK